MTAVFASQNKLPIDGVVARKQARLSPLAPRLLRSDRHLSAADPPPSPRLDRGPLGRTNNFRTNVGPGTCTDLVMQQDQNQRNQPVHAASDMSTMRLATARHRSPFFTLPKTLLVLLRTISSSASINTIVRRHVLAFWQRRVP